MSIVYHNISKVDDFHLADFTDDIALQWYIHLYTADQIIKDRETIEKGNPFLREMIED